MKKQNYIDILFDISEYYSSKLSQYGETAKGVDWNGEKSQVLRFEQLCKVIDNQNEFSINDLGCGYGALYDFLRCQYHVFSYSGIDISKDMIEAAKKHHYQQQPDVRFILSNSPDQIADYSIASGIFNVKLNSSDDDWLTYLKKTLHVLDRTSRFGFAFNCLTSYSDAEKMRDYLYYADPCLLFDYCKKHYSKNIALLHDYGLYEFTILVRKQ